MKGNEWIKEIQRMDNEELEVYSKALNDLLCWKVFVREYDWTGLSLVWGLLSRELIKREVKK